MRESKELNEMYVEINKQRKSLARWITKKALTLKEAVMLEAKYLFLFGKDLDEEFSASIETLKNKRILELFKKCYDKGEYPNPEKIENTVKEEYLHYENKRREMLENYEFALFFMELEVLSPTLEKILETTFQKWVFYLHPDCILQSTSEIEALFLKLQRAFDTNDIEKMDQIQEEYAALNIPQDPKDVDFLKDWSIKAEETKQSIQNQLEFIKSSFPLNQKDLLEDEIEIEKTLQGIRKSTEMHRLKNRVVLEELEKLKPAKTLQ